jgi:hypothetical protein
MNRVKLYMQPSAVYHPYNKRLFIATTLKLVNGTPLHAIETQWPHGLTHGRA